MELFINETKYTIISSNDIISPYMRGIAAYGASLYNTINDNCVYSSQYQGIFIYNTSSYNKITDNYCIGCGATSSIWAGLHFDTGTTYNTITGNYCMNIAGRHQAYGLYILAGSTGNIVKNNHFLNNEVLNVGNFGTGTIILDNDGYIAPGEIRTYSGTITGGAKDNVTSIDNPFGQAVRVLDINLEITNQSAAGGLLCAGVGPSASADYETMLASLPTDVGTAYPYFFNSIRTATYGKQSNPVNWATGSGNRYLNFYSHAATTGLTATYTITVMGN